MGLRAVGLVAMLAAGPASAQSVCTESQPCLLTVGSPGRSMSISTHRLLFGNGQLVWPSFVDVFALDLTSGRTRSLPHCGTAITHIALDGSYVYVLADHSSLCRVTLSSGQGSVQMLVAAPDMVISGFAVSPAAVAYAARRRGQQPEVHVVSWDTGRSQTFPTWVTVEPIAVDDTSVWWIDAGFLVRVAIATGAKTVGPRVIDRVTRIQAARGTVFVATEHEVLKLDAAGTSWITVAHDGADDLAVDGSELYIASARHAVTKVTAAGARTIGPGTKPYALALDPQGVFVVEETPFVIKQVVPR